MWMAEQRAEPDGYDTFEIHNYLTVNLKSPFVRCVSTERTFHTTCISPPPAEAARR